MIIKKAVDIEPRVGSIIDCIDYVTGIVHGGARISKNS